MLKVLFGPVRAVDPETYSIHHIRTDGLEPHGYDVRTFALSASAREPRAGPRATAAGTRLEEVLAAFAAADGWRPDLVLVPYPGECSTPPDLVASPAPTVAVVSDWDSQNHQLEALLPWMDHTILEPGARRWAELLGLADRISASLIWRPSEHHLDDLVAAGQAERPYDLAFLGSSYSRRHGYLTELAGLLSEHRLYFSRFVPIREFKRVLGSSKIGLNISRRGEMTPRCLETMLCGALLLTNRGARHLADHFVEGEQYVAFDDVQDAAARVKALLDDPQRLKAIARAGHERTKELLTGRFASRLRCWLDLLRDEVGLERLRRGRDERLGRLPAGGDLERQAYLAGGDDEVAALQRFSDRSYGLLLRGRRERSPTTALWLNNQRVAHWHAQRLEPTSLVNRTPAPDLGACPAYRRVESGLRRVVRRDPAVGAFALLNLGCLQWEASRAEAALASFEAAAARLEEHALAAEDVIRAGVLLLPMCAEVRVAAQAPPVRCELNFRGGPQLWSFPLEPLQVGAGDQLTTAFRAYLVAFCHWARGSLLLQAERPGDAVEALERAMAVLPEDFARRCCGRERAVDTFELFRTLGDAYRRVGRGGDALQAYGRHLSYKPEDWRAWPAVMGTLAALGRHEELEAFCREKLRLLAAFPGETGVRAGIERVLASLKSEAR